MEVHVVGSVCVCTEENGPPVNIRNIFKWFKNVLETFSIQTFLLKTFIKC